MSNELINKLRLAFSVILILSSILTFAYSFFYGESFDQYFYLAMIMIVGAVFHLQKIEESKKPKKKRSKK
tara:strand:- start:1124 stop:1333 length:210 start_codon:yes stop_codon:yes gene_type:complete